MTLQLWLTTIVAVVGQVTTVVNGIVMARLTARNADKLAVRTRELDRGRERRKDLEDVCDRFLLTARQLCEPDVGATDEVLRELQGVVVRIERLRPNVAESAIIAHRKLKRLVTMRSEGMWSDAVTEAERECDSAIAAVRDALVAELSLEQ
ncbi:hypothetical protein [Nocardia sp. NPDC051570]|uniref:hypothetical protein n=1 Tax=Nocardia sp. NPDC051570 TaxID=3364324 RepID=UPI0037A1201A